MTGLIMPSYQFPREMPLRWDGVHPFESATFDPLYAQSVSPTRGSMIQVVNLAADLWRMTFQSHVLEADEALQYLSWLQSLRGGARLFKAWHPLLEFPQAYPDGWDGLTLADGGDPFTGTAVLADIETLRDGVSLAGLPEGFDFSVGDMLSIAMGAASRTLHRVMEAATSDGDGEVDLTVEPIIPLSLTVSSPGQEVLLEKPYCLAVVDAASIQGPWQGGRIGRVQFNATQTF